MTIQADFHLDDRIDRNLHRAFIVACFLGAFHVVYSQEKPSYATRAHGRLDRSHIRNVAPPVEYTVPMLTVYGIVPSRKVR